MLRVQACPPDADAVRGMARPDACRPLFRRQFGRLRWGLLSSTQGLQAPDQRRPTGLPYANRLTSNNLSLQSP